MQRRQPKRRPKGRAAPSISMTVLWTTAPHDWRSGGPRVASNRSPTGGARDTVLLYSPIIVLEWIAPLYYNSSL